jgi:predicted RND superfamily exporter protein
MAYGITRVSTTAEIRKFLPQDYPSVRTTLELENKFGRISYESVLIKSNDVTKVDIVHTILRLENTLEDDPELENYITRVEAYTDYVIPLIENYNLLSDYQLEQSVQYLLDQPGIKARVAGLLSENREAALIKIYTNTKLPDMSS